MAVRRFFEPTPSAFPCVIHESTFYGSNTSVSLKYPTRLYSCTFLGSCWPASRCSDATACTLRRAVTMYTVHQWHMMAFFFAFRNDNLVLILFLFYFSNVANELQRKRRGRESTMTQLCVLGTVGWISDFILAGQIPDKNASLFLFSPCS